MPEFKLHYFPLFARGEAIRQLLTYSGADFENHVIDFPNWPKFKPQMPDQQIPVLELSDGTKLCQSNAILRFLGKRFGYYPKHDDLKAYKVDMIVDRYNEVMAQLYPQCFCKPEEKDALVSKLFDEILPSFMPIVESLCSEGHKFLIEDSLTIADFLIGGLYTNYINNPQVGHSADKFKALAAKYPKFAAYGERYSDEMKPYLQSRSVYIV